jgi:hypothetical protein
MEPFDPVEFFNSVIAAPLAILFGILLAAILF